MHSVLHINGNETLFDLLVMNQGLTSHHLHTYTQHVYFDGFGVMSRACYMTFYCGSTAKI